jgi:hypothetical protein
MICPVCQKRFVAGHWTDTYGVCVCSSCGVPWRILPGATDTPNHSVGEWPVCLVKQEWINPLRLYLKENPGRLIPSGYNFTGSSFEMCSSEDFEAYNKYFDEHQELVPEAAISKASGK